MDHGAKKPVVQNSRIMMSISTLLYYLQNMADIPGCMNLCNDFLKKCYEQPHHHEPGNHQESFWQLILHAYEPLYLQFNHLFFWGSSTNYDKGVNGEFPILMIMVIFSYK